MIIFIFDLIYQQNEIFFNICWCNKTGDESITIEALLIPNVKVRDAVNIIIGVGDGGHYLVVYPDLPTLQRFYTYYVHKLLNQRDGIVYLDLFYESLSFIRKTLSEAPFKIDAKMLEEQDKLIIIESQFKHNKLNNVANNLSHNIGSIRDEHCRHADNNHSFLNDMAIFIHQDQIMELVDYESNLASVCHPNTKFVCLYHKQDFNQINNEQREILIKNHLSAISISI